MLDIASWLRARVGDGLLLIRDGRTFIGISATDVVGGAGGLRQWLPGSFAFDNIAAGDNATPASSTAVAGTYSLGPSFPALRAGSITGFLWQVNANPAGSAVVVAVTINGTVQAETATTLAAGATRLLRPTFTKGAVAFVAGDLIGMAIKTGTGWSATTADAIGAVQVES